MATEHASAGTSEKALRERIHRLFCADAPAGPSPVPPLFWVGPTEEQRNTVSMDIEERIILGESFETREEPTGETRSGDAQSVEQRWLSAPHVGLDGASPEAMLTGGEHARERLCAFVAAIEAAVRQGSFS